MVIPSFDATNWSVNSIPIGNTVCTRNCSHHQSTSCTKVATFFMVRISLPGDDGDEERERGIKNHQSFLACLLLARP